MKKGCVSQQLEKKLNVVVHTLLNILNSSFFVGYISKTYAVIWILSSHLFTNHLIFASDLPGIVLKARNAEPRKPLSLPWNLSLAILNHYFWCSHSLFTPRKNHKDQVISSQMASKTHVIIWCHILHYTFIFEFFFLHVAVKDRAWECLSH